MMQHVCFEVLDHAAQGSMKDMLPQELANLAWAAAKLGYVHAPQLVTGLIGEAASRLKRADGAGGAAHFNHQDLAILCWAAAVANVPLATNPWLFQQLQLLCHTLSQHWDQSLADGRLQAEGLLQLAQLHIWLHDTQQPDMLPPAQLQQCMAAWRDQQRESARQPPSVMQQQVYRACKRVLSSGKLHMTLAQQQEVPTEDGLFTIDMVGVVEGRRLAIEVDGPSHFTLPHNTVRGDTAFRNRALADRGYPVVSIPYFEWRHLNEEQQLQYMERRLKAARVELQAAHQSQKHAQPESSTSSG